MTQAVSDNQEEIAGWRIAPQHKDRPGRFAGLAELFEYLPRIVHVLRPYWKLMLLSVVTLLLAVANSLLLPWPMTILIDSVLGNQPLPRLIAPLLEPSNPVALLFIIVFAEVAIKLFANWLSVVQNYADTKLELQVDFDFRSELFQHAQRLSLPFYEATSSGGLAVGLTYESMAAGSLVLNLLPMAQSLLTLGGMVWISFQLDRVLTLVSLLVVPFVYYSLNYYSTHIRGRMVAVRGMAGQSIVLINEVLRMLRVIVAFGREEYEYGRFRSLGQRLNDLNTDLAVREAFLSIAVNMTTAVGTSLVLGLGAYHVLNKQLSTGELLLLLSYIAAVYTPLQTISAKIATLQNLYLSLRLGFHILDTQPEIADGPGAQVVERARGAVRFEAVSFDYPGRLGTLKGISFEAQPGQVIAVVGPTGAGKTTLLSLLPRFYDPSEGQILLDGYELKSLTLRSVRSQIAMVLQEPLLFSGSIADNIRYGRLEASEGEIVAAAQAANAHEFIRQLPQGYATLLGEKGARLSGGERQRICIARAFVKNAPILILDEPTSSLDSKTESVILDALERLMEGRTTFITAHRLSTVRHSDLILVLNQGRLVEKGTHEGLLKQNELYKQLYELQIGQILKRRRLLSVGESPLASLSPTEPLAPTNMPAVKPGNGHGPQMETAMSALIAPVKKKIVLLGMMSRHPEPGVVWQTLHYLIGLRRLGYEPYYVEAHGVTPNRLITTAEDDGSAQAASFIGKIMDRFDLKDNWAFHALHADGKCYGMSEMRLRDLYQSAELIINLHGGTMPRPEHYQTGRLVFLETDPVELQIQLYNNFQETIDYLAPHIAFFTFGENYGRPSCYLPVSDQFHFKPTRQPVIVEWWRDGQVPVSDQFTTIGNWQQRGREVSFKGETYTWSKHYEFLKFLDLPRRTSQMFELALSGCTTGDRHRLETHGWHVIPAQHISADIDLYKRYIQSSRAEFTVAKDQNVRLRTGWFSDRSATYLAAGKPVVTQETGFSEILPAGTGLFGFQSMEEILAAVQAINADYRKHSRAAQEIAREYFDSDVVLNNLLSQVGTGGPERIISIPPPVPALGEPLPPMYCRVRVQTQLPTEMRVNGNVELQCVIQNLGRAEMAGMVPFPIHISYKWLDRHTGLRIAGLEGLRTGLGEPLRSQESREFRVQVQAPSIAGDYILSVTLVQEHVAWFDELSADNGCSGAVQILPATLSSELSPGTSDTVGA